MKPDVDHHYAKCSAGRRAKRGGDDGRYRPAAGQRDQRQGAADPRQRPGPDCDRRPVDRGHVADPAAGRSDAATPGFADHERNTRSRSSTSRAGAAASQGSTGATATLDSITLAPDAAAAVAALATPATTAPNSQLSPLETLAVSLAAQTAATQQTSLAPLFANLGVAAGLADLPPQVQQAVAQVLAQQTSLDQNLTGSDIKQAFQTSGLFLEASLASGWFVIGRHAGPQGGTDRAAPGADDIAGQRGAATPGTPATAPAVPQGATAATVPQGAADVTAQQVATPLGEDRGNVSSRARQRRPWCWRRPASPPFNFPCSRSPSLPDRKRLRSYRPRPRRSRRRHRPRPQPHCKPRPQRSRRKFSTSRSGKPDSRTRIDAGGCGGAGGRKQRRPQSVAGNASGRPACGGKSVEVRIRKQPDACADAGGDRCADACDR